MIIRQDYGINAGGWKCLKHNLCHFFSPLDTEQHVEKTAFSQVSIDDLVSQCFQIVLVVFSTGCSLGLGRESVVSMPYTKLCPSSFSSRKTKRFRFLFLCGFFKRLRIRPFSSEGEKPVGGFSPELEKMVGF